MDDTTLSRRAMLAAAATAGTIWATRDFSALETALAHATAVARGERVPQLGALPASQMADLEAMCARIMPTDDTPGAREAGVIHFIDRALSTFAADRKPLIQQGLADVRARVAKLRPRVASFAALTVEQQDQLLTTIEKSEFFTEVRNATMFGMFANPSWGGNRGEAGWKLLGFEPKPIYSPPFGYYDAEKTGGG
jgi:gluconate 2-dehydrogenase gamma chain